MSRRCTFHLSVRVPGLGSHSLGHFSICPCSEVIKGSFKVTFVHYLWLVVKSATADQAFMGLNVSYTDTLATRLLFSKTWGRRAEGEGSTCEANSHGDLTRLEKKSGGGERNTMKEKGGRGTCTAEWTEHGSVKRKGREGSLSHSFSTPCSEPPSSSLLQADKGTEGCSPCTEEGGGWASLWHAPFFSSAA